MGKELRTVNVAARDERRFDGGAWITVLVLLGWLAGVVFLTGTTLIYPTDGRLYGWDNLAGPFTAENYIGETASPSKQAI